MNPFENTDDIIKYKITEIILWLDKKGRKSITHIEGWNDDIDKLKEHIKIIKKTLACNASISIDTIKKTNSIQLQGDHIDYIYKYLINNGIDNEFIKIKG